jgi:serine/threonine protein kinase
MEVAIKQFKEEGKKDEFLRELLILSQIRHPNIITYFSSNPTKRFIVMELIVHGTLHNFLQSDVSLTWPDKITIGYDIVKGVSYLHQIGIIHGDLRPKNLLVSTLSPFHIKIFDFEKSHSLAPINYLSECEWHGDIRYQSPEICKKCLDRSFTIEYPKKVDVYNFSMCLIELITSLPPFHETQENSIIMRMVIEGLRPQIPENIFKQFKDIMKKCWNQDAIKRPEFNELCLTFQQLDIHGPQLEITSSEI